MRIETYGKAPTRYGKDAYKVGLSEGLLLEQGGWRVVGQGREYVYVQLPEGTSAKNVTLTLPVPTDAEIEQLAMEMHRQGTLQRRVVDGVPGASVQETTIRGSPGNAVEKNEGLCPRISWTKTSCIFCA